MSPQRYTDTFDKNSRDTLQIAEVFPKLSYKKVKLVHLAQAPPSAGLCGSKFPLKGEKKEIHQAVPGQLEPGGEGGAADALQNWAEGSGRTARQLTRPYCPF